MLHSKRKPGVLLNPIRGHRCMIILEVHIIAGLLFAGTILYSFTCSNSFNPQNNPVFIPTLQMGKLRLREVNCPRSHSYRQQSQDSGHLWF